MRHSPRRNALITSLVALAALLAVAPGAHAQSKAFKIRGSGVGPGGLPLPGQDPRPHWIVGQATHLGRHYGEGTVKTDSAEFDPTKGEFTGEFGSGSPFVFTAADGDQLATYYGRTDFGAQTPGSFVLTIVDVGEGGALLVQAVWVAEFVVQPELSTGRFAGTTGSWIMIARSEPFVLGSDDPVYYSWEGEGRLTFAKGQ